MVQQPPDNYSLLIHEGGLADFAVLLYNTID